MEAPVTLRLVRSVVPPTAPVITTAPVPASKTSACALSIVLSKVIFPLADVIVESPPNVTASVKWTASAVVVMSELSATAPPPL